MKNKKIQTLIASLVINLCVGSIYAWSVFAGALSQTFDWSPSEIALVFTIANGVGPITMIIGGKLQDKYGPKWVVFAGAFLYGGGLFASGFVETPEGMYLTYGICMGFGLGTIYSCTIANTVKLFPERKGLIAGLTTCVYGMSTVVAAPLAQQLIDLYGVSEALRILGIAYFVIVLVCSQFLVKAEVPEVAAESGATVDKTWKEMLKTPIFYGLLLMLVFGATSGLMIISQASMIAQEVIRVSAHTAAIGVSVIAITNAFGRIIWGRISDRFGRYSVLLILFGILTVVLYLLTRLSAGDWILFLALTMIVGFCFGGFMGIFPALTAEKFGIRNNGVNYGFMFIGFAVGGYLGPQLAATFHSSGDVGYDTAFFAAAGLSVIGVACAVFLFLRRKK